MPDCLDQEAWCSVWVIGSCVHVSVNSGGFRPVQALFTCMWLVECCLESFHITMLQGKENFHLVAYLSWWLIQAECNYKIFNKEMLKFILPFKVWRDYLKGIPNQVTVIVCTDIETWRVQCQQRNWHSNNQTGHRCLDASITISSSYWEDSPPSQRRCQFKQFLWLQGKISSPLVSYKSWICNTDTIEWMQAI